MAQGTRPTSEVLTEAADMLKAGRWVQGDGWPGAAYNDGLCLEGGIMAALGLVYDMNQSNGGLNDFYACPAYKAVREYLDEKGELSKGGGSVWGWNDTYWRTKAQVLRVLRTVARREKKKELASE